MTDETKVDEGSVGGGTGLPNQNLSSTQTQSIPSQEVADIIKRLEIKLETQEKELRGLQSRQDKGSSEFSEFAAEYRKQQKKGLNDTDAEREATSEIENERLKPDATRR